ncbi:MAG: sodium:calcium antiporter [Shinella sp.]|nr:MAG: sodium:calcium antiporter [Shinella sp.]
MLTALAWSAVGLLLLVAGSEFIVRGGTRFAGRLNISPVVIGATIIAIGTSTPELAVGIDSVLTGNGNLAIGNIAGTNVVNILLILGLSALMLPMAIRAETLLLDLPMIVVASCALLFMASDGYLSRNEGIILLIFSVGYTAAIIQSARRESRRVKAEFREELREMAPPPLLAGSSWQKELLAIVVGIAVVVYGADFLVKGTVDLARLWGVSEEFIGLTIIAIGTSSPELVTTIVSTLRNQREIAIGNLLGSSVYNILVILGITIVVPSEPVAVSPSLIGIDIPVMTAVALLCVPVFYSGRVVSRFEGALMVGLYLAYLAFLVVTRT